MRHDPTVTPDYDGAMKRAAEDERARIRREQAGVIAEMRRDICWPGHPDWADRLEEATRDV